MRLSIFFLLLPSLCIAQQTIDAEQFFALGLSNFKPIEESVGTEVNFPWIDKYEFRTETNDFDLDKQEYTLRLSPSTARIRSAQKVYYETLRNAPDFDGQEIYCDYILSLHLDWLSLFILNENQKRLTELAGVLNDKQLTYERMLGADEFDPGKLVRLQTEKSDLEISLNKLKLQREYFLNKYNIQDQEIDFGGFITIETLAEYLANNTYLLNGTEMVDVETEYKKQLLIKEIELESSEEKRLVDFVQLKYNGPHSDGIQERLAVGLGFQLSNSGSNKLKLQKLQIEQEELNRKSERDIQEKKAKLYAFEEELQSDIQAFFHFEKIMEEERTELQNLSAMIAQQEGTSPLVLLDIEERHLSMMIKSLNKKEDLLENYLKYLHQSGKMCQADFVNFLTQ